MLNPNFVVVVKQQTVCGGDQRESWFAFSSWQISVLAGFRYLHEYNIRLELELTMTVELTMTNGSFEWIGLLQSTI